MTRLLLIVAILLGLLESALALEITFKQNAQVDDAVIKLGDVANFDEQNPLTEALATKSVGQAPPPGETLVLKAQNIKQYFLANHTLPGDTTWKGFENISIRREGVVIGPDRIQEIIAEYLVANKSKLPEGKIKFIAPSLPLPFTVPTGLLKYEVIPSNPGILSSSSFSIIFKVDDRIVKNMSVRGKVEAMTPIVVAAESLKKGLILGPQHLKTVVMDVSEIANPAFDPGELIGMQLVRSVPGDSPVVASMVDTLPIIKRGQKVRIIATSGSLHLTATGLAHSDGKLDQMIKVQNLNSNKIIFGRVAAPGTVEVVL